MKRNRDVTIEFRGGLSGGEPIVVMEMSYTQAILSIEDARRLLEALATCINITVTEYERWRSGGNENTDT